MDRYDLEMALEDTAANHTNDMEDAADWIVDRVIGITQPLLGKSTLEMELLFANLRNEIVEDLSLPSANDLARGVMERLADMQETEEEVPPPKPKKKKAA
jgi:hypothetical protein